MGIFKQKKKSPIDVAIDRAEHVFDESFRKELRDHGRAYFEKIIDKNARVFKDELDETIKDVYTELKQHVTSKLDDEFFKHAEAMKDAQKTAVESLTRSTKSFQDQNDQLSLALKKTISDQESAMADMFKANKGQIEASQTEQASAITSLKDSIQSLQAQQQLLSKTLEENIAKQQEIMVGVFQDNMAQVIEHYLLGALGDQYDLKAQLPSIIKQMEENKDAIVEDMKL